MATTIIADLEKADERAALGEKKCIEFQAELHGLGNNLKSLEISEEKVRFYIYLNCIYHYCCKFSSLFLLYILIIAYSNTLLFSYLCLLLLSILILNENFDYYSSL